MKAGSSDNENFLCRSYELHLSSLLRARFYLLAVLKLLILDLFFLKRILFVSINEMYLPLFSNSLTEMSGDDSFFFELLQN